jgi:predicted TIM-barrel fold metal-dependent hydrolase
MTDASSVENAEDDDVRTRGVFVIDTDVHVNEPLLELAEYIESPWDVGLREVSRFPLRYLDIPGVAPRADFVLPFPGGAFPGGTGAEYGIKMPSAADMRRSLDELGVDLAILFPDNLLLLPMVKPPDFAVALASAYNAWLYERWLTAEPTLKGAIVVAPQDPHRAAAEIRKWGDAPEWVAVYLAACGVSPLYGHHSYDAIYRAATEVGLPLMLHSVEATYPVFPFQLSDFNTSFARHTFSHPVSMMANMISMLETGVQVRYPELRFAATEGGVSWVPFLMNRLDKSYLVRRRELPFLSERPSHYILQWYFATQPIEEPRRRDDIVRLFELFDGENRAMFASDWPHHDFDHPRHVIGLPFSAEAKSKIMGGNAARFLHLQPTDSLRSV